MNFNFFCEVMDNIDKVLVLELKTYDDGTMRLSCSFESTEFKERFEYVAGVRPVDFIMVPDLFERFLTNKYPDFAKRYEKLKALK